MTSLTFTKKGKKLSKGGFTYEFQLQKPLNLCIFRIYWESLDVLRIIIIKVISWFKLDLYPISVFKVRMKSVSNPVWKEPDSELWSI